MNFNQNLLRKILKRFELLQKKVEEKRQLRKEKYYERPHHSYLSIRQFLANESDKEKD